MASFDATSSAVPDSLLLARQADRLARQATNTVMQDTISRPALGDSSNTLSVEALVKQGGRAKAPRRVCHGCVALRNEGEALKREVLRLRSGMKAMQARLEALETAAVRAATARAARRERARSAKPPAGPPPAVVAASSPPRAARRGAPAAGARAAGAGHAAGARAAARRDAAGHAAPAAGLAAAARVACRSRRVAARAGRARHQRARAGDADRAAAVLLAASPGPHVLAATGAGALLGRARRAARHPRLRPRGPRRRGHAGPLRAAGDSAEAGAAAGAAADPRAPAPLLPHAGAPGRPAAAAARPFARVVYEEPAELPDRDVVAV